MEPEYYYKSQNVEYYKYIQEKEDKLEEYCKMLKELAENTGH